MSFTYPIRCCLTGSITSAYIYKTEAGDIYEYRFKHIADGVFHEISLCTRNKQIEDVYQAQLCTCPLKAKVVISSDGVGFEVLEIKILK